MAEIFDLDKFRRKKDQVAEDKAYLTECMILSGLLFRKYPEDFGMNIAKRMLDLPHSQSTYKKRLELVENYSSEDLEHWLTESRESQWNEDPAFFRAIAKEVKKRMAYASDKLKK